jgi:hypothetical protein
MRVWQVGLKAATVMIHERWTARPTCKVSPAAHSKAKARSGHFIIIVSTTKTKEIPLARSTIFILLMPSYLGGATESTTIQTQKEGQESLEQASN